MEKNSVETIVATLEREGVRYLIVGGLAVVAHGHVRFTADLDLVLAIDRQNLSRAVAALESLDYRPRAPVPFEDFLDPDKRAQWMAEKHMTVFSVFSPKHRATEIDLFLEPPLDFATAYSKAFKAEIEPGVIAAFCSLEDLIAIKTRVGRPIDIRDVEELLKLGSRKSS